MNKHTISLCMIVKNEEKYLDKCLESVKGKVDEIIIVDTGSTDRTIEIAQKHNAIIKHFEWIDDFAAARNCSIGEVNSEYILILDADEYLDSGTDLQKTLEQENDFYQVLIKNYQSSGSSVIHQSIRLFKAGIGLVYKGKLHEHLNTYGEGCQYKGSESDILLHHEGYLYEVNKEKGKQERNYGIMVKELKENRTGYSLFNMGMIYLNGGEYENALDMFKKSYPLSKDKTYVKGLLTRMGECLLKLDRIDEALELLSDAVDVYGSYPDLHYALGLAYKNKGYLRDAEYEFKRCLEIGDRIENMTTQGVGSYLAHYNLATIYVKKNRLGDAFDESFKALIGNKSYYQSLALYLKLMQRSGISNEEIQKQLEIVYPISSVKELYNLLLALYQVRHPLMCKYDFLIQNVKIANLRAVAYMMSGDYIKSFSEWKKINRILIENVIDVMVLTTITEDISLLDKIRDIKSYSDKEYKFLKKILGRDAIGQSHYTQNVENTLLDIAYYLLDMGAFDHFEYISRFLIECSVESQNKLVSRLISLGYLDTSLELLSVNMERYTDNCDVLLLAGDIFVINKDFSTAMDFYNRSLAVNKNYYPTYERLYEIYEATGDMSKASMLVNEIKLLFPFSRWVKSTNQ